MHRIVYTCDMIGYMERLVLIKICKMNQKCLQN